MRSSEKFNRRAATNTEMIGFLETEETIGEQAIRAMEEMSESQAALIAEYSNTARALLMTCRHLMTGREINQCENATGDHDTNEGFDGFVIDRLANQFPREIAAWQNGRANA